MSKTYGLTKIILYCLTTGVFIVANRKNLSPATSTIIAVAIVFLYSSLFYEVIKIKNGVICFYSLSPLKKNLKFNVTGIKKIEIYFNDFSRGVVIVHTPGEIKKIEVAIGWEQKKFINYLIGLGLNVE